MTGSLGRVAGSARLISIAAHLPFTTTVACNADTLATSIFLLIAIARRVAMALFYMGSFDIGPLERLAAMRTRKRLFLGI
jgi:hypothetical protein